MSVIPNAKIPSNAPTAIFGTLLLSFVTCLIMTDIASYKRTPYINCRLVYPTTTSQFNAQMN
jgi:hypothetical protein